MKDELICSPKLRTGDLVRLVSPASYPSKSDVDETIAVVESWGLRCDLGDHILDEHGYMAGSDEHRLDDLNKAYADPDVRAIIATRGGAGAYRISNSIDFSVVQSDPKPMLGFSDITNLHLSLLMHCGLGGIHGCLWGHNAIATARQLLMSTEPIRLTVQEDAVSARIQYPGTAKGRLIGGNLCTLAHSIGVQLPSLSGAIVFIEHSRLGGLGVVDRCFTQLLESGVLNNIAGVVLGSFECMRDFSDRNWDVLDVLNDRLKRLGVPVLGGIPAGHDLVDQNGNTDQSCIPLGSMAEIDVASGLLTINPVVC